MTGDNLTHCFGKTRTALADSTNKIGKREFSLMIGNSMLNSEKGFDENMGPKEGISKFDKGICVGVENMTEEESRIGCIMAGKRNDLYNPKVKHACVLPSITVDVGKSGDLSGIVDVALDVNVSLASNNIGSLESSSLSKSHDFQQFGLEKCKGLKASGVPNRNSEDDLLKECSCSFCAKAAFIWSDLHYQDIKGRISVLKKSQKEAGILVQRNRVNKETNTLGHGDDNLASNLKSDLLGHWRSLFLYMEDIFSRESNQIEASSIVLKDLRESCKTELELINGMPSDGQNFASDASGD